MRTVILRAGDKLAGSVDGVPDLLATRCLCFGFAIVFLCIGVGVPWLYATSSQARDAGVGAGMLVLVLSLLMLALAVYAVRTGWHAGAWFRVDASGIHYGPGRFDGATKRYAASGSGMRSIFTRRY